MNTKNNNWNNWKRNRIAMKIKKEDQQVAIKEQVSKKVAERLPDQVSGLVVETAKTITKNSAETGQNLDQEFMDGISFEIIMGCT